jgi:hypothetical protein
LGVHAKGKNYTFLKRSNKVLNVDKEKSLKNLKDGLYELQKDLIRIRRKPFAKRTTQQMTLDKKSLDDVDDNYPNLKNYKKVK